MLSERRIVNTIVADYNKSKVRNREFQPKTPMDMDAYYARLGEFLQFLDTLPFRKGIIKSDTMVDVMAHGGFTADGTTFAYEKKGQYHWYTTFFVNGYFVSQLYVGVSRIVNTPNYVKLMTEEQKNERHDSDYKRVTRAAIKLTDKFSNNTKINTIRYAIKCLDDGMMYDQQAAQWVE